MKIYTINLKLDIPFKVEASSKQEAVAAVKKQLHIVRNNLADLANLKAAG